MKTIITFFLLIVAGSTISQSSLADLKSKKVAWTGVDFSLGKFLGKSGFNDLQQIKDHYFSEWNNLTMGEQNQNLKDCIGVTDLELFVDPSLGNNNNIKITKYVQDETHRISEDEVKAAVKSYDLSNCKSEIGMGFFVEFFSKQIESASIYFTLYDISSKEIFFIKQINSKPKGFGFRNYWMGAIKSTIATVNSKMKKWKKGKD